MAKPIRGMTLVELLIVLSILAGLVTMVALNTAGLQNRRRADDTTRIGREIADAWKRADGLSFVSDFGEVPNSVAKIQLLFRQTYPVYLERDKEPLPNDQIDPGFLAKSDSMRKVPPFGAIHWTKTDASGKDSEDDKPATVYPCETPEHMKSLKYVTPIVVYPPMPSGTSLSELASKMPTIPSELKKDAIKKQQLNLFAGWRGPYCNGRIEIVDNIARDGFGGAWLLQRKKNPKATTNPFYEDIEVPRNASDYDAQKNIRTATILRSCGQDRRNDDRVTKPDSKEMMWEARDQVFDLYIQQPTLQLKLKLSDQPENTSDIKLHVYIYEPRALWKTWAETSEDEEDSMRFEIGCKYYGYNNLAPNLTEKLTIGTRAIFAWAEIKKSPSGSAFYYLSPCSLLLKPGNNTFEATLRNAN